MLDCGVIAIGGGHPLKLRRDFAINPLKPHKAPFGLAQGGRKVFLSCDPPQTPIRYRQPDFL